MSFTITGVETQAQTLTGFASGLITRDGVLNTGAGSAVTITGTGAEVAQLNVQGVIDASGNNILGKIVDFDGVELVMLVGADASLSGLGSDAIGLDLAFTARAAVVNHGAIHADGEAVIVSQLNASAVFQLNNTGDITSWNEAIRFANFRSEATIINSGRISGGSDGIAVSSSGSNASLQILNSGTFTGGVYGIDLGAFRGSAEIVNSGEILGDVAIRKSSPGSGGDALTLTNSGVIQGTSSAYDGNNNVETIVNSGLMLGDVALLGGNDFYDGRLGQLTGKLDAGAGADRVLGGDGAETFLGGGGDDTLNGGGGDDDLSGGAGDDLIRGKTGDDVLTGGNDDDDLRGGGGADSLFGGGGRDDLRGGAGDDTISGGASIDTLRGGEGHDTLDGNAGGDELFGGAGDDIMSGQAGSDTLFGGDGDDQLNGGADGDRLKGGRGNDTLTGEGGADIFEFIRRDGDNRIVDFDLSEDDKIDLIAFGLVAADLPTITAALVGADNKAAFLDFEDIGGEGSVLIENLDLTTATQNDLEKIFILTDDIT